MSPVTGLAAACFGAAVGEVALGFSAGLPEPASAENCDVAARGCVGAAAGIRVDEGGVGQTGAGSY